MTNETKLTTDEPKRRANSAYLFTEQDGKMVFDFGAIGKATFDPDKASAQNRARAMKHGFKQRIIDAAALSADAATGKTSPAEKLAEMIRVIEHLESGSTEWNLTAKAGGGSVSYVTRALVRLGTFAGVDVSTPDKANAYVKSIADSTDPKFAPMKFGGQVGKVRDWLAARSKTVMAMIETIKAEEAQNLPEVDADALLEEAKGA